MGRRVVVDLKSQAATGGARTAFGGVVMTITFTFTDKSSFLSFAAPTTDDDDDVSLFSHTQMHTTN